MPLLDINQAAEFVGLSPNSLRAAISKGRGPDHTTKPFGSGGRVSRWFTKTALKAWRKAQATK